MFVWGLDDLRGFTAVGGGGSGLPLGFNERRRKSTIYYSPVQVPDSFANSALLVSSIAPSNNHISVVATDGALLTWGMNSNGELGDGYSIVSGFSLNRSQPLIIGNLNSYSSFIGFDSYLSWTIVSSVNRHVAGITTTGGLYAWGENSQGQIGDNSIVNKSQPIKIGNSSWSVISSGNQYTLGILTNNILYAWGNNFSGQLGDGTTVAKSSPIQIGTSSWSIVEAGENSEMQAGGSAQPLRGSAFGKDISGKLFAWGQGTLGQLADSTIISKSSPVQVATSYIGVGVSSVAAGVNHSVFLSKNSSGNTFIHTTGENNVGQLGDGTTINRSIPVPISEKTKGNTVYAGANTSFKV
jgi:alpha-tubulin suppressor-like RCC1 family protein